jgi:hypothetical protein
MLPLVYNAAQYGIVQKPNDLFRELGTSSESIKVKQLYDAAKLIFGVSSIQIEIAQGESIYKYSVLDGTYQKNIIGYFFYMPKTRRLDIWVSGELMPLIQFKGKSVVFKNYSAFLDKIGLEKLFDRFSAIL